MYSLKNKFIKKRRSNKKIILLTIIILILLAIFITQSYRNFNENLQNIPAETKSNENNPINLVGEVFKPSQFKTEKDINLKTLPSNLPGFTRIDKNTISLDPKKYDQGSYTFDLSTVDNLTIKYNIVINSKTVDYSKLESDLKAYFGNDLSNYGIYINDLLRKKEVRLNDGVTFEPASMAKLTTATLVMRDIDAGKYTLETTYPIKNSEKFNYFGAIGGLPEGTQVKISEYLNRLLTESDNNAWYILTRFLGNSYQVVNQRTIDELQVNPLFLDPPMGTASNLGKVLTDLYNNKTLTKESADYIFDLLQNAVPSLREGVGLGLPSNIKFANKIGTLLTEDKISYQDSAIIWGEDTDYVLVVMDKQLDWDTGKVKLKEISEIVYKALN